MAKKENTTVWDIAAQRYMSEIASKTATTLSWGHVFDNAIALTKQRDEERKGNLKNLLSQQPDFDLGDVLGGTEEEFSKLLTVDNLTYREVADKLSRISVDHKDYESLTKQLNDINKRVQQAKLDNDKLKEIRNGEIDPDEWGTMTEQEKRMWTDIISGDGSNFKAIDGKMYWVDPENLNRVNFEGGGEKNKVTAMIQAGINTDNLNKHFNAEGVGIYDMLETNKEKQEFLLNNGYDISYTYKDKNKKTIHVTGKKAIDGEMGEGSNSLKAEKLYLNDRASVVSESEDLYKGTGVFDVSPDVMNIETHKDNFISVSNISNDGPRTRSIETQETFTNFLVEVLDGKKKGLEWNDVTRNLYDAKVQSLFRGVGEDGVMSLIFDDILPGFDNEAFQLSWIMTRPDNINKNPEDVNMELEIDKMIQNGITYELKQHLKDYYIDSYLKPNFDISEESFNNSRRKKPPKGKILFHQDYPNGITEEEARKLINEGKIKENKGFYNTKKELDEFYSNQKKKEEEEKKKKKKKKKNEEEKIRLFKEIYSKVHRVRKI